MQDYITNFIANECHFTNCDYYSEGKCLNYKHRLDCVLIASRTLCLESIESDLFKKIFENKKEFPIDDE